MLDDMSPHLGGPTGRGLVIDFRGLETRRHRGPRHFITPPAGAEPQFEIRESVAHLVTIPREYVVEKIRATANLVEIVIAFCEGVKGTRAFLESGSKEIGMDCAHGVAEDAAESLVRVEVHRIARRGRRRRARTATDPIVDPSVELVTGNTRGVVSDEPVFFLEDDIVNEVERAIIFLR